MANCRKWIRIPCSDQSASQARAIDRDQIHADFHQGARPPSRFFDAVYMAATDQMLDPSKPLATQEPSIHGPSESPNAPDAYGPPKTLYNRWTRWSRMGVFARIMAALAEEAQQIDMLMIDSTHLKAHRTASSLRAKKGGPVPDGVA